MKIYLIQEIEDDEPYSASTVISADNEDDVKKVYENEFGEQFVESLTDESELY